MKVIGLKGEEGRGSVVWKEYTQKTLCLKLPRARAALKGGLGPTPSSDTNSWWCRHFLKQFPWDLLLFKDGPD